MIKKQICLALFFLSFMLIADLMALESDSSSQAQEKKLIRIKLHDNSSSYYATVKVGTPGQSLKVAFDTEMTETWIPSSTCKTCATHARFNSKNSSTFKDTGKQITLADDPSMKGKSAVDAFNLGGLKVAKHGFVLMSSDSSDNDLATEDGYIGLGFGAMSKTLRPNFVEQAANERKIEKKMFAFWLGKQVGADEHIGELSIGGFDRSRYSGWSSLYYMLYFYFVFSICCLNFFILFMLLYI